MKIFHNLFLLTCFLLTLGCGESSVGESQSPANANLEPVTSTAPDNSSAENSSAEKSGSSNNTATGLDAASPVDYIEGTHYERLANPVPTTVDASEIEVAEVFWYGCVHCYHFEPLITEWAKTLPDDVTVVKSPAMWDNQGIMEKHARIYYTAKALGVLDTISPAAFQAMNVDNNPLRTESAIENLFTSNGVNKADFERTFNSFGVTSAVRQAEARQKGYRIQGTPEIIVEGTYRITGGMAGSQEAMLKVADYLVNKAREEQ